MTEDAISKLTAALGSSGLLVVRDGDGGAPAEPSSHTPLSLLGQADFVDGLVRQCEMAGGSVASRSTFHIGAAEYANLRHLAIRLRRMAPHESKIRRLVTGE